MKPVVILRPEPGAGETARRAKAMGMDPVLSPLFEIVPLPWSAPDPAAYDALLLTSANAVRHAGPELAGLRVLPAWAVGEATAQAARESRLTVERAGDAGVEALLGSGPPEARLLHLCGKISKEVDASQQIDRIAVYSAEEREADIGGAQGSVVLIHSPRAGKTFAELANRAGLDRKCVTIAAISNAALEACGRGWADAEAADRPDDQSLLALARSLCNKPDPE